jgi:hypothetical protein
MLLPVAVPLPPCIMLLLPIIPLRPLIMPPMPGIMEPIGIDTDGDVVTGAEGWA